jgi:hypothetical protein
MTGRSALMVSAISRRSVPVEFFVSASAGNPAGARTHNGAVKLTACCSGREATGEGRVVRRRGA